MTDQDHAEKIRSLTADLNTAIIAATQDGLVVVVDQTAAQVVGQRHARPVVLVDVMRPLVRS